MLRRTSGVIFNMEASGRDFEPKPVRFSSVCIGNKQIRFIYFRGNGTFHVSARQKEEDVPLFLGADVLNGSSILVKNHGRVHARFSKDKVATKVNIKGATVEGIHHSSQLWFYNVQGLFRVAFEYLSQQAQQDCLLHLKDIWLETLHQVELPPGMCLKYCPGILNGLSDGDLPNVGIATSETSHQVALCGGSTLELLTQGGQNLELLETDGSVAPPGESVSVSHTITGQTVNIEGYGDVVVFDDLDVSGVSDIEVSLSSPTEQPSQNTNQSNYVDSIDNTSILYSHLPNPLTVDELSRDILSFVKEQEQKFSGDERTKVQNLEVLIKFFRIEFVEKSLGTKGFPFELFHQYLSIVSDKTSQKRYRNAFDIPLHANIVLCIICEWLGKELNNFSETISKRVETFKLKHIDVINHLPSAQSLVNALFPACMKILMVNWIGEHGIGCAEKVSSSDHDYSPPSKKQALDTTARQIGSSFPFVQLILEFANNVLISGVAHVVYTRLLHDGSC